MTRVRLPDTRQGITLHFKITSKDENENLVETDGYLQTGEYEDGALGEIFIRIGKPGSSHALYDQFALRVSVELQDGKPVVDLFDKHRNTQFEPSGVVTGVEGITRCTSPLDLISRFLIGRYGKTDVQELDSDRRDEDRNAENTDATSAANATDSDGL